MSSCSTADSGERTNSLCPSATRNSTEMVMTLVWGTVLLAKAAISVVAHD
jgi:hypothetical protein